MAGKTTNWLDLATRSAQKQEHNISVSGASKNANYYVSLGYQDVEGIAINDKFQRATLRTNVSFNINDNIKFGTNTTIELTELALALEEVVVYEMKLTGYLEIDIKQVPINNNFRYSISGLPNVGYESSVRPASAVTKALNAIFNPVDFLYKIFGREPNQLIKLKRIKQDDQIRNALSNRFDREMLIELLDIDKIDLDFLITQCNYSDEFISKANDLQVLDAISECYEEYKVLNRTIKN